MKRLSVWLAAFVAGSAPVLGQDVAGRCATPDSIAVVGNSRVSAAAIRGDIEVAPGQPLNFLSLRRSIRNLFATGNFEDVKADCTIDPATGRTVITVRVRERPVLADVSVVGAKAVSPKAVRDRADMPVGQPLDPAQVARVVSRVDSLYESRGYYLAHIRPDTTRIGDQVKLTFRIDEGRKVAVSGVRVRGERRISAAEIVKTMKTRPEGFWWWRKGSFDDDKYAADVADRVPTLYANRGFLDFQVTRDTVIVDRSRGKALIDLSVTEGPQYHVGSFEATGNHLLPSEELNRLYPFTAESPTLGQRLMSTIRRKKAPTNVFDRTRWEDATNRVRTVYSNQGYIYASVRPVVERAKVGKDSTPVVNLRWEIEEGKPAIVNRIEIAGNDYTSEACIRDALVILPGDVFSQDRLVRSYQNIANLGFFETPLPTPTTDQANEQGDVNVVFRVKERRTGSVNLGASAGQGTGLGGVFGLDQPNLFGQCKRASLQWQFGRYLNDFNLSFTDPAFRQSRTSVTVGVYNTQSRYRIADLGTSTRRGGSLQFGFPIPWAPYTSRLFISYGGETVKYRRDANTLLGSVINDCKSCFRSTLGVTATRDTRIDLPFASAGGLQTASAQFSGGPLGGTTSFQRYTTELRGYAPLFSFGAGGLGSQPVKLLFGLTTRAGAVFGDPGPFFYTQSFGLGGTQYGEQLRGYCEFSITPSGYDPTACNGSARRSSFGSVFFTSTAEVGLRINQIIYTNVFYDAGNLWNHPENFDPTRLFRSAGVGVAVVTPLGPLGLDWAYGFDRQDLFGRPDPKWQLHFKLGNVF